MKYQLHMSRNDNEYIGINIKTQVDDIKLKKIIEKSNLTIVVRFKNTLVGVVLFTLKCFFFKTRHSLVQHIPRKQINWRHTCGTYTVNDCMEYLGYN